MRFKFNESLAKFKNTSKSPIQVVFRNISLVIFLILTSSFNLLAQDQNSDDSNASCHSDGPIYYAKKNVNIHQEASKESAVIEEIPAGDAIIVLNSFLGDAGWWEICYQGTNGWVLKAYLTRNQPYKKTEDKKIDDDTQDYSLDNENDVGFDPFLAKTKSNANFRMLPSTRSRIIRKLPIGTRLYVYSETDISGFCKVIDIKTGKTGWVSKNLILKTGKATIDETGSFQSTGTSENYGSEIIIKNKSSITINLVVGKETFQLKPHSTETETINPGQVYYIGSAPGVIPTSGYQTFDSYHKYEWEFWVRTTRY